jgi:hypothetical protein
MAWRDFHYEVTQSEKGSRKKGDWLRAELTKLLAKTKNLAQCLPPFAARQTMRRWSAEKGDWLRAELTKPLAKDQDPRSVPVPFLQCAKPCDGDPLKKGRDPDAWRRPAELYTPLVYGWCRVSRCLVRNNMRVSVDDRTGTKTIVGDPTRGPACTSPTICFTPAAGTGNRTR